MNDQTRTNRTSQPKLESQRRSVHFAKTCKMSLIPNLEDYSDEDMCSLWMDPLECKSIRDECLASVSMMNLGVPESEDLCYRGLEWKGKEVARRRKLNRARATVAVLEEQEKQWQELENDPASIRALYRPFTQKGSFEAYQRAIRDYENADNTPLRKQIEEGDKNSSPVDKKNFFAFRISRAIGTAEVNARTSVRARNSR
jgi:hypothetical protein